MIAISKVYANAIRAAKPEPTGLVAPCGSICEDEPWAGCLVKRPWQYSTTVAIPHIQTPDVLEWVIALWQKSTIQPYILVIDTGSDAAACEKLERLRADNVEIHYVRSHGYEHPSMPVTVAMDLAFALCQTPYLLATHSDVFPRSRTIIEEYKGWVRDGFAAVGYEMSPRPGTDKWQGLLSHTLTMYDMAVMRRHCITWSLQRYFQTHPKDEVPGWPDTESGIGELLRRHHLPVKLVGRDQNICRQVDERIDHARSYTGSILYCRGTSQLETARRQMHEALMEAQERLQRWA